MSTAVATQALTADASPMPPRLKTATLNVLTVDIEDWFQVTNFERFITRDRWTFCPTRILHTVPRVLDLLDQYEARATFFSLGWIARRFPSLIRRIKKAGHELATHGDEHRLITSQKPEEFRAQLLVSRDMIEQAAGTRIYGHRAPSYSFRKSTKWVVDILLEAGIRYDSSIFPFGFRWDRQLCAARFPCVLPSGAHGELIEYPLSTSRLFGCSVPMAGGGYFRLLPYSFIRRGIDEINRKGFPVIMYFHPWEIDPDQPHVKHISWLSRFRHYHGLERMESKLRRLLSEFQFGSIRDVFWSSSNQRYGLFPQG